jgi:3-oxoacyl-ACP reductase-like protein
MTMGFFSTILDKLGLSKAEAATPAATAPAPTAAPAPASAAAPASAPAAPVVNPIAMVDVVALMEAKAKANPQKLNWRTSIVDLLKLLDMDSSLQARKELAKELYCPDEFMNDSAKMNVWLHKNVLAHIAANGGNVPKELLD